MVLGGVRRLDVGCYAFLGSLGIAHVVADQEDTLSRSAVDDRQRRHRGNLNGRNVADIVVRVNYCLVKA